MRSIFAALLVSLLTVSVHAAPIGSSDVVKVDAVAAAPPWRRGDIARNVKTDAAPPWKRGSQGAPGW